MKVAVAVLLLALAAALGLGMTAADPVAAPELRQRRVRVTSEPASAVREAPGSSGLDGLSVVAEVAAYAAAVQAAKEAEIAAMTAAALEAELAVKQAQLAELEQQGAQLDTVEAIVDESGVPAVWQCIHEHEQPDWHAPGNYEGGLGIMTEASDNYREQIDPSFPDPAYTASPAQQVAVAEWVLSYAGWDAWATADLCM